MSEVHHIWSTPKAEEMIVKMARVSAPQNQDNMETAPKLLNYLIKHKHWSPFEMAAMTMEIQTTRGIAPQILRHRSFTFQEFCLAGNARVTVSNGTGGIQRLPIENLYQKWSNPSFKARYARSYDDSVGRFIEAPILSVYESGEKPVYRFQIGKKSIDCTREHRVLTKERGFVEFGEAYDNGLTVALNGKTAAPLPYQDPKVLADNAWMGSTRFAEEFGIQPITARKWFRKFGITPYNLRDAARSAIDISFEGRKTSFMKWARDNVMADACSFCGHDGSESRLELSHIIAHDKDPDLCFDENNLQTLCASCHRQYDIETQGKHYGWTLGMTAKWKKIDSQTYLGVQMTYDIEMDHPTHNFVVDGIVVHNSQRYANTNKIGRIEIPQLRAQDPKNRQNSTDTLVQKLGKPQLADLYRKMAIHFEDAEHLYQEMISLGVAKESARFVLPLASPTKLYMQGTLRSWIHYIQLRTEAGTQLEHRALASAIQDVFCKEFPIISEALDWLIPEHTGHS